jgi:hypothetical protein
MDEEPAILEEHRQNSPVRLALRDSAGPHTYSGRGDHDKRPKTHKDRAAIF